MGGADNIGKVRVLFPKPLSATGGFVRSSFAVVDWFLTVRGNVEVIVVEGVS